MPPKRHNIGDCKYCNEQERTRYRGWSVLQVRKQTIAFQASGGAFTVSCGWSDLELVTHFLTTDYQNMFYYPPNDILTCYSEKRRPITPRKYNKKILNFFCLSHLLLGGELLTGDHGTCPKICAMHR